MLPVFNCAALSQAPRISICDGVRICAEMMAACGKVAMDAPFAKARRDEPHRNLSEGLTSACVSGSHTWSGTTSSA